MEYLSDLPIGLLAEFFSRLLQARSLRYQRCRGCVHPRAPGQSFSQQKRSQSQAKWWRFAYWRRTMDQDVQMIGYLAYALADG
jgi:hypothetical protein